MVVGPDPAQTETTYTQQCADMFISGQFDFHFEAESPPIDDLIDNLQTSEADDLLGESWLEAALSLSPGGAAGN